MLGTGNALVTECYNTCFVLQENEQYFMVDGGGGNMILHQLKHAGIRWQNIHTIFVTHKHLDHIMGIMWMLRMICEYLSKNEYEGDVTIYAHDEVTGILNTMALALLQKKESQFIGRRIHLIAVTDGEKQTVMGHTIQFFDICSTKAKQFGFTMDLGNGRKLTDCGDEPYNEYDRMYVENSTWLLHEAFCLNSQADVFKPYEKHHSTVKNACELAEQMHVRNLLLYHTEDRNLADRKKLYMAEGRQYYTGNLFIPDDLEVLEINESVAK